MGTVVIARQGADRYAVLLNPDAPAEAQRAVVLAAGALPAAPLTPVLAASLLTHGPDWHPLTGPLAPGIVDDLAASLRWAGLTPDAAEFFDPDQARDEHGRWTSGGGAGPETPPSPNRTEVQRMQSRLQRWRLNLRTERENLARAERAGDGPAAATARGRITLAAQQVADLEHAIAAARGGPPTVTPPPPPPPTPSPGLAAVPALLADAEAEHQRAIHASLNAPPGSPEQLRARSEAILSVSKTTALRAILTGASEPGAALRDWARALQEAQGSVTARIGIATGLDAEARGALRERLAGETRLRTDLAEAWAEQARAEQARAAAARRGLDTGPSGPPDPQFGERVRQAVLRDAAGDTEADAARRASYTARLETLTRQAAEVEQRRQAMERRGNAAGVAAATRDLQSYQERIAAHRAGAPAPHPAAPEALLTAHVYQQPYAGATITPARGRTPTNRERIDRYNAGLDAFRKLAGPDAAPERPVAITMGARSMGPRSHYDPDMDLVVISPNRYGPTRQTSDQATVVHELAHWLEETDPYVGRHVQTFYEQRTQGEQAVSMNQATGRRDFRASERTKVDRWVEPYMGKVYAPGRSGVVAHEVLSMGMQHLYGDPAKFARTDPEMFTWLVNVLHRKLP